MATNEVYKHADWISLPVGTGVESGSPVVVGQITGVAQTDADDDGNASVALTGAFNVNVATGTVAVGAPVYVKSDNTATPTATGNQLLGMALAAKASAAGVIPVRLTGFSPGAGSAA